MKRRLYVDGNTVYGIDEECIKKKQGMGEKEQENYLALLLCAFLRNEREEIQNRQVYKSDI